MSGRVPQEKTMNIKLKFRRKPDPEPVKIWQFPDRTYLHVRLTDEGIIMDAYDGNDQPIGTDARMAEEWFQVLTDGLRICDTCGAAEDAGGFPDWVNGRCETCDPSISETVPCSSCGEPVYDGVVPVHANSNQLMCDEAL
jgi:hypothetical protein